VPALPGHEYGHIDRLNGVLHQIAETTGQFVAREIPPQNVDELSVRIDEVKEAAVIDSIIVAALRMRRDIDMVFPNDGGDLILGAGERNDMRIERLQVLGERVSRFGSTVMKIGCTAAASGPSRSRATPISLSAVGHASGQEVYPKYISSHLPR
jgi:hypothetical protein